MLLSINPLWVLGWIQSVPMSELKGCFVSTGSVACWAVLTHVIGFRLSYVVSSSESCTISCPPLSNGQGPLRRRQQVLRTPP
jgi:hypothetical protein